MGRGVPLPKRLADLGERLELAQRGPGQSPRPKTNFVHFVAARRTLIAIIRIVSAVMDVGTHTAKHEQQICDHVYIHTPYIRVFFQTINLQSTGCGQACGVNLSSPRRNAISLAFHLESLQKFRYGVPPFQKVLVWRSGAFQLSLSTVFMLPGCLLCWHFHD